MSLVAAGAGHGGDVLIEVAAALKVLLDGAVAVPAIHLDGPTAGSDVVSVFVIVAW